MLLLLIGCETDQGLFVYSDDVAMTDTSAPNTAPPEDTSQPDDTTPPDDTQDTDDEQDAPPRAPRAGELVISELMVNPAGVSDDTGEWVELYSAASVTLDLSGLSLGDDGVDDAEVVFFDAIVSPGELIVLCASEVSNGGVSCQGTYLYQSFGGGFALSNSEDEVVVLAADGTVLDAIQYSEGFSVTGQSMGVAPGCLDATANDAAGCWCAQSGPLSSGDYGNPGSWNDGC
jgi:hypothetical protein